MVYRYILLFIGVSILMSGTVAAYEFTPTDTVLVDHASQKIEAQIDIHGISSRATYLQVLAALRTKYTNNDRVASLIDAVIARISIYPSSDISATGSDDTSDSTSDDADSDNNTPSATSSPPPSRSCYVENGRGSQEWQGNTWGDCEVTYCDSGYIRINSTCEPPARSCTVNHGTGQQTHNEDGTWGICSIHQCDDGYTLQDNQCTQIETPTDTTSTGNTNTGVIVTRMSGCDQDDIMIGSETWAACDLRGYTII